MLIWIWIRIYYKGYAINQEFVFQSLSRYLISFLYKVSRKIVTYLKISQCYKHPTSGSRLPPKKQYLNKSDFWHWIVKIWYKANI